jgi:hypothetical protein
VGGAGAGGAARARRRRRRVRGGACARLRSPLAPLVPREGALEARLLLPAQLGDELARHVRAPLRLEVGGGAVLDELKVGHLAREGAADARLQHRRRVRLEREPPALAHPAVRRLDRDRRAAVLLEVGERAVPPPAARDAVGRLLLGHPVPLEHRHERGAPARAGVAHVAKRLERREGWVGGRVQRGGGGGGGRERARTSSCSPMRRGVPSTVSSSSCSRGFSFGKRGDGKGSSSSS